MSEIIWKPSHHVCDHGGTALNPEGTIARCGECNRYSRMVVRLGPTGYAKTWKVMDPFEVLLFTLIGRIRTDATTRP